MTIMHHSLPTGRRLLALTALLGAPGCVAGEPNCVINPRPTSSAVVNAVYAASYGGDTLGTLTVNLITAGATSGEWTVTTDSSTEVPIDMDAGAQVTFEIVSEGGVRSTAATLVSDLGTPSIEVDIDIAPTAGEEFVRPYEVDVKPVLDSNGDVVEDSYELQLVAEEFQLYLPVQYTP